MNKLIEALQIFSKYGDPEHPTGCLLDVLHVMIRPDQVSTEDAKKLAELSFEPAGSDSFRSFDFGSA